MKPSIPLKLCVSTLFAAFALAGTAFGQLIAYDDAGNYLVNANWTNGANQGFGFTPWVFTTNGPDFTGTYITNTASPTFVIASDTNVLGTNYACVWGVYANGTDAVNQATVYRGFANSLGTNTFKLQWGSRGAGTTTVNGGTQHGYCGWTLRNGNATNSVSDFNSGAMFYLFFQDGNVPSTLWVQDGNGLLSVPNTSFSNLGRNNITNAVEAEITPGSDGLSYHLVLKDCVLNQPFFVTNSIFQSSGTVDSAALFCQETSGDQVYNHMQITSSTNVLPTISNVLPADGSLYLNASSVSLSFEVDSFNSTVSSNEVAVYLNGVALPASALSFNSATPTNQLLVTSAPSIAPDTFYNYAITAEDAFGNTVSNVYTFNTFLPTDLYIDAYDYNYNEGQFVNSSTPSNSYSGFLGTNGIDYNISDLTGVNNTAGYRSGDLVQTLTLATDNTGDPYDHANLRANGFTAYNVGFTAIGNWENYTRVFPAANYNVYTRAASASGGQFEIDLLANATATTTNQPLAALGRVNVPNTGGSKVFSGPLFPVTDIFGSNVVVPLSGTRTIRETALQSAVYNLEYLLLVADNNAVGTLRPYLSVASPAPNSTGVGLAAPISFTIANRQTTVTTASIQVFLNTTNNLTSHLVISSNAAGAAVAYTPTANLLADSTNLLTVIYADSASVSTTNSWNFVTAAAGGVPGNGFWSAGGGFDLSWSTAANWTGGTPGPGFTASFGSVGATTNLVTNNIVSSNVTVLGLFYDTNNAGYNTTLIEDGVTLTVTNGTTSVTAALQAGATTSGDIVFNKPVTNTITGPNGTLQVLGNPLSSGLGNSLNVQIRQSTTQAAAAPNILTFDMSGLGNFVATVGKFTVAQGGSSASQSNVSAAVYLAMTNIITCLRPNSGQFEVGDSSGGIYECPGSSLFLGITNALFIDTAKFGHQKATNNVFCFKPAFTNNATPSVYIRGTNGVNSFVSSWTIGDDDTESSAPNYAQALVDFSGGTVDARIGGIILGRGETGAGDTGSAQGTLTFTAGTLNVNNLTNGVQRAISSATESGIVNVNGTGTLISTNLILAQAFAGATPSLVTGTLNVTNGTVRANIVAGGGVSTINFSGGKLMVTNGAAVGAAAAPITALNISSTSLHLIADGNASSAVIFASAIAASGTTTISIDSVTNVTGTNTIHLISYSGTDPYPHLALALPSGYSGNLLDNAGSIDLNVHAVPLTRPTFSHILTGNAGQIILSGTNNAGPGGTYHILTSTNVTLPLTNWTVLGTGSFDANGNFSSTNSTGTNSHRFYLLEVP